MRRIVITIMKASSHHEKMRSLFESTSFVVPNYRNSYRSKNTDMLRDSSTQTSRTAISLGITRSPRMSPDSLSPKTDYQSEDDFVIGRSNLQFSRKSCVLRYLHKPSENQTTEDTLPESSLTKVFLEKTRKRSQQSSPKVTRSNFLQQTSPLRNIVPIDPADQQMHLDTFKSHSYAAFCAETHLINTRFKVKSVKSKPPVAADISEKDLALNLKGTRTTSSPRSTGPRNRSFMSPTFSSEQKNKMREIDVVTRLISPTKRGRSASPKANVERSPSLVKKVPYIDKSSSSIFYGMGDTVPELNLASPNGDSQMFESISDSSPEHHLVAAIVKMRDSDWNVSLRGLAEIVEICRNADINVVYPHMTVINQRIIDMLKSSRSHICRTTCKAAGHLFEYIKDTRRPEFDEIVDTLLCRTADSNKFIRHDANLALDCMVTHIPSLHAVRSLCAKGTDHKNALVRIATARLLVCAVVIAGPSVILNPNNSDYTRRRVILNMVKFLNDKSLDVRRYGERLYKLLYGDRMFDLYLRRYLEKETVQKLKSCFREKTKNGVQL